MVKLISRIVGCLAGLGMVFPALAPRLGLVTDWETVSSMERMVFAVVTGACAGAGIAIALFASGLLLWLFQKVTD